MTQHRLRKITATALLQTGAGEMVRPRLSLLLIVAMFCLVGPPASAATTVLISADEHGEAIGGDQPSMSSDGRFVAFRSSGHIYVVDRDPDNTGVLDVDPPLLRLVSVHTDGTPGAGGVSARPSISRNGRYVVFESTANNLVDSDTNGASDIFRHDLLTGVTIRVSVGTGGVQASGPSFAPTISDDGQQIAFESDASNLSASPTNGHRNVYAHDRDAGRTMMMSVPPAGAPNGNSVAASISGDGRFVAFQSAANNLVAGDTNGVQDIFLRDRNPSGVGAFDGPGATTLCVSACGNQTNSSQGIFVLHRIAPRISGNGRFIAYTSKGTDLVEFDFNTVEMDMFVYDRIAQTTRIVNLNSLGMQSPGPSGTRGIAISTTGRFVAFDTSSPHPWAPGDFNEKPDIFLRDRDPNNSGVFDGNGVMYLVSLKSDGTQSDQESFWPVVSDDGLHVAFHTTSRLTPEDSNFFNDVYVRVLGEACMPPNLTQLPASQTVCAGGAIQLSVSADGTPPFAFQWRRNEIDIQGATSSTLTLNPVTANHAGDYDVVVTNACGEDASDVAVIGVNLPPSFTANPANQVACVGQTVILSASATGSGQLTYLWQKDGANLDGETGDSLTLANLALESAGSYRVVASNDCGSTNSTSATVTVQTPPGFTTHPVGREACTGQSVSFNVVVTGNPAPSLQWHKNGNPIANATASVLNLSNLSANDAGNYTVVATNTCGTATSNAATLSITSGPQITQQASDVTSCVGGSATLTINTTGADLTYQWRKGISNIVNGGRISGANSPSLTINNLVAADAATNYVCVVTNSCGNVTSNLTAIRVNRPPIIDLHPTSRSASVGGAATFSVAARGSAPLTYQWRHNGVNIPGATDSALLINPVSAASAGSYDVIVSNSCGNLTSASATLTVLGGGGTLPGTDPPPQTPPPPSTSICGMLGGGTALTAPAAMMIMLLSRRGRRRPPRY